MVGSHVRLKFLLVAIPNARGSSRWALPFDLCEAWPVQEVLERKVFVLFLYFKHWMCRIFSLSVPLRTKILPVYVSVGICFELNP